MEVIRKIKMLAGGTFNMYQSGFLASQFYWHLSNTAAGLQFMVGDKNAFSLWSIVALPDQILRRMIP